MLAVFVGLYCLAKVSFREDPVKAAEFRKRQEERELERQKEALRWQEIRQKREVDRLRREEESKRKVRAMFEEMETRRKDAARKKAKLVKTEAYLSQIDPFELENLCLILFTKLGYEAKATPRSHDNGVDGFLRKGGKTTILQCKRYQGVIGEPAMRDLLGSMKHFRASSAVVVTTGRLTRAAVKWIRGKPIRVIEREELAQLIKDNIGEPDLIPTGSGLPPIPPPNVCPECGTALRKEARPRGRSGISIYLSCPNSETCAYQRKLS